MDTLKQSRKPRRSTLIYLGSFGAATLLMALVLLGNSIYPGSKRTLLVSDMWHQFMPFLASLRYIGTGDNSIFFNWSRSCGGNFIGLFAYYLASPLSWLTVFFDLRHMPEAIYVLTLLKIGLCGLTFSIFLNKGIAKQPDNPVIILFSCCYALMSYNMAYSFCIMWLDCVILLPLVLLGVEQLLAGRRGLLYLVSITACFYVNYYLSYMVGCFTLLYLLYRIFAQYPSLKKEGSGIARILIRFGCNTLLGIGIAMPLLLPTFLDLRTGRMLHEARVPDSLFNFSFFSVFGKLISSQYDTIENIGALPSLFCGTLTALLGLVFFFQKKHTLREKTGALLLLLFLLVSFWFIPLDKAWQCFQLPNWLPYRYAFTFSTLLILLAYRALEEMDFSRFSIGKTLYRMCCLFTLIELFFNGANVIGGLDRECVYGMRYEFEDVILPTAKLVQEVQERDDGLYRMDKDYHFSINDGMLLNYNSMSHSSSAYNFKMNEFIDHLGLMHYYWFNMNYGSTLLTDSLFGVRYSLAARELPEGYRLLDTGKRYSLYENPAALPLAYMVSDSVLTSSPDWKEDPFQNQNLLLQQLADTDTAYFTPVPFTCMRDEEYLTLTFEAPSEHPVYLRLIGEARELSDAEQAALDEYVATLDEIAAYEYMKARNSVLTVNGINYGDYFDIYNYHSLYVGSFLPGEEVTIRLAHHGLYDIDACYLSELDTQTLLRSLSSLAEGGVNVTTHKNGGFTATVTVADHQALLTSIQYDKGFRVEIDGQKADYACYADALLLIPLEPGTHELRIRYISPGVTGGCIIALCAILLTIGYYRRTKKDISPDAPAEA